MTHIAIKDASTSLLVAILAIVATVALFGYSTLRNLERQALKTASLHQLLVNNRSKQSQKEYEIQRELQVLKANEINLLQDFKRMQSDIEQLTGRYGAEHGSSAPLRTPSSSFSAIASDNAASNLKNRIAVQDLLTRLMRTQNDIADRLSKIEENRHTGTHENLGETND